MKFSKRPLIVFGIMSYFVLCTEVSNFGNASAQTAQRSASKAGSVDEWGLTSQDWKNPDTVDLIGKAGGTYRLNEYVQAANNGNVKAMVLAGLVYKRKLSGNMGTSLKEFIESSKSDLQKNGSRKDDITNARESERWLREAANHQNSYAMYELSEFLDNMSYGMQKDLSFLDFPSERDGPLLEEMSGVERNLARLDLDESYRERLQAQKNQLKGELEQHQLETQKAYNQASQLENNIKSTREDRVKLLSTAANLGNSMAMFTYAGLLKDGYSREFGGRNGEPKRTVVFVETNTDEAVKWYRQSANLGNEAAILIYAQILAEGKIALKNDREAQRLWRSLVAKNSKSSLMAARLLGTYYNISCLRQGNSIRCP